MKTREILVHRIFDVDFLTYEKYKKIVGERQASEDIRKYMKSVVEETEKVKKVEGIPILAEIPSEGEQTILDQYNINPFRSDKYTLEGIRRFLMFQATKEEITEASITGNNILKHARAARINYNNRMLIKR